MITASPLAKLFVGFFFLLLMSCVESDDESNSATGLTVTSNGAASNNTNITRLNDTGITWAGEYTSGNKAINDCTTITISGDQDCHQGRDSTHNDDTDGVAGFSFTKLDNAGTALIDQTQTIHACVEDKVTGLTWEVKETSGTRSSALTYKWGGLTAIGRDHASKEGTYYDDWNVLVNDENSPGSALCGFTDWRLPTIEELRSIAYLGQTNPAIDQNYFPNAQSDYYWSSSPDADASSDAAWLLDFGRGTAKVSLRNINYFVRLVRDGE